MASSSSHNGINDELYKELWMACAGPLVDVPVQGERVFYFPQGHIEQLQLEGSVSHELISQQISKLDLPYKMLCRVADSSLKVDQETGEVFAIIKLHPFQEVVFEAPHNNHPRSEEAKSSSSSSFRSFSKILTISDTNTHSGFSVPKKIAENCLPPLDLSLSHPYQELYAKDLHGHTWRFTHVYRASNRRHVIAGGWSMFVASNGLVVGDALIFVRHSNNELGIGIRRSRQQIPSSSSILPRESMHQGILASASYALYTNKEFVVYYNPRAWPFVVRLHKYMQANAINFSSGMNVMMRFNGEEDSHTEIRYAGVVVEETDLSEEWPGSTWRSIKVRWYAPSERTTIRLPDRMSRWQLDPIRDARSDVSDLEAESSSSRNKRVRISDHGSVQRANANWGDSLSPLHAIPSSSTVLVDTGKECENPQVLRLFGVDIQVVAPYSSGRIMVPMQGNALVQTVDLSSLGGYEELKNELEKMFKIQGELCGCEKWEVVYQDGEGDLRLFGDKPWWEFCKIVKKILIRASDYEGKKMIDLGFKLYL